MRVLAIVATCVALSYSARVKSNAPTFSLSQERSSDGSPSVQVTFPDGYTDKLILAKYYSNEADRLARVEKCHFIGHLEKETEACAAMTGCPGSDDLEFTIMSAHGDTSMYVWRKSGEVERIESPFKNGLARVESVEINRDDGEFVQGTGKDSDEEVNAKEEAYEEAIEQICTGTSCQSTPTTMLLKVLAGYDAGFKNKVGSDEAARAYIEATLPHVQASYCHSSLGTQVKIQRTGNWQFFADKTLTATGGNLEVMMPTVVSVLGDADLLMTMSYDTEYYGTVGIAYRGVVCIHNSANKYKQSINEWRKTFTEAAHVIAHEIGHNLGFRHDFDAFHDGKGCNGQGIMSYGDPPNQWSSCTVSDFNAHYISQQNNWCMEPATNICGGNNGGDATTAAPTTTTTTTTTTTYKCVISWIKDGYCDDENNNAACQYDGGDCCPDAVTAKGSDWNYYCKECSCKQGGAGR